jgi:hypothetical protein
MKARTFLLTAGTTFALAVPAANATATKPALEQAAFNATSNALFQARLHTILFDQSHHAISKRHAVKSGHTATEPNPAGEPTPKSVGEALGAAIVVGDTPAAAAASAAALAQVKVERAFGAPTGAALVQAAMIVQDAYGAAGASTARASASGAKR